MSIITESTCDECGRATHVLLAMEPGIDGGEWYLCGRCWIQGVTPKKSPEASPPSKMPPSKDTAKSKRKDATP